MEQAVTDAGDTRARILEAAETLLRRHGLEKLNVIDVARVLNMSHGNVYRHFASKAELRATVIERWLDRIAAQTEVVAHGTEPGKDRLCEWLHRLAAIKQRKVVEDAELLVAAARVVRDRPSVEHDHSARLTAQVVRILYDGVADGTLPGVSSPEVSARAILNATVRFHHPELVVNGGPAAAQSAALSEVISLLMTGLS